MGDSRSSLNYNLLMLSNAVDTSAKQSRRTAKAVAPVEVNKNDLAYPRLSQAMLERLFPYGKMERLAPNDSLFRRGDREVDMFVILD